MLTGINQNRRHGISITQAASVRESSLGTFAVTTGAGQEKCNGIWNSWVLQVGRLSKCNVGNALIRDSEGCALCGEGVHVGRGIEPRLSGSTHAVNRFVQAIFGDTSKVQNPSQWASMMHDLKITVHIIGMPPGAWKVN
jgi:hypothetical protein